MRRPANAIKIQFKSDIGDQNPGRRDEDFMESVAELLFEHWRYTNLN